MTFAKALFEKHLSHAISIFMCGSLFILAGCQGSTIQPTSTGPVTSTIRQFPPSQIDDQQMAALPDQALPEDGSAPAKMTRIGVLLPLSGNAAHAGEGLRNAAVLAQFEVQNPGLLLQFYDTKGTPEGAFNAAQLAISHGVSLFIGPLFSNSVEAIAPLARAANVPILSFATNARVITNDVYATGFLLHPQIDRIIGYAAEQGRKKFAILSPDTAFGRTATKAAENAIIAHGGTLVRSTVIDPHQINFMDSIKELTQYNKRKKAHHSVDFDALFLPVAGQTLQQVISLLSYYDVNPKHVKLLGTLLWQDEDFSNQPPLRGAWFPAASRIGFDKFVNRYTQTYGSQPSQLTSLAYDMVTLAAALSEQPNPWQLLTARGGFIGVNGAFRLEPNGRVQRMLSVQEVKRAGSKVISPAPTRFLPPERFSLFE